MSVAFRRESDEEHKEPRFEIPIAPGPNWVTPRGAALIADRITDLEARIAAEADADSRAVLQRDLRYWHTRQTTAESPPPPPEGAVGFGSHVGFRLNGKARTIEIVGGDEADPAAGRIAFFAPLARALMGAEIGEQVEFQGVEDAITITAIAPPSPAP
jgi:transcription elongation GreA/GreB family factor